MDRIKLLQELKKYGQENDVPNISLENACFLRGILRTNKVENMLEIGTANGYSTIHFASEIENWGGKITTIDFSPKSHEEAKENFKKAQVENSITPLFGNALDIIPTLTGTYDFVFIDGMKKRSKVFLELVWDKVQNGGVIVIDDVIKFRDKMEDLYIYVEEHKLTYNILPIDEDDGIMMIMK